MRLRFDRENCDYYKCSLVVPICHLNSLRASHSILLMKTIYEFLLYLSSFFGFIRLVVSVFVSLVVIFCHIASLLWTVCPCTLMVSSGIVFFRVGSRSGQSHPWICHLTYNVHDYFTCTVYCCWRIRQILSSFRYIYFLNKKIHSNDIITI